MGNTRRVLWSIRVTEHLNDSLDKHIERAKEHSFLTKSEFVRTAVRNRLKEEEEV